jgi:predicted CXXCH cytochrome family protein
VLGWEIAQILGLSALICCLTLLLLPVRPRTVVAPTLSLRRHEIFGWLALIATGAHVAVLLAVDHQVFEHLRLTAPPYEGAGVLALLLLMVLAPLSTGTMRRLLWSRHRSFQAVHVGVSCILVPLLAVHVITSSHFVHGTIRVAVYVAISVAALLALLRARNNSNPPANGPGFLSRRVFGRHSRKIVALVAVCCVAIIMLLGARASMVLREPFMARATPLKVDFPHDKHREVNCVECHHNFIDRSGSGGCFSCHRSARVDLRAGAEARFHEFCLGCHRDPPPGFEHHGPVTGCAICHLPKSRPTAVFQH